LNVVGCLPSALPVRIAVFALTASLNISITAQSPARSHRELVRQIRQLEGAQAMINMPSVAPLFLEDAQFSSTLYIVNEGNPPVAGRLLLLSPDGHIILDKTVTVSGHDKVEVPIKPLLESANSNVTRGSLELFDDNVNGSALAGEVVITFHGESTSVNIDEELLMPTMSQSHELRGLAINAVASPVISVNSTSDQPVQIAVKCIQERSKPTQSSFHIRSHEMVTLRPCADSPGPMDSITAFHFTASDLAQAEAKGIQILSADPKAEIQVFGFSPIMTDGALSFAPISFHDPDDMLSTQSVYPGVPIGYIGELWGTYQPRVVVQNYSSQTRTTTIYNARTRLGTTTYGEVTNVVVRPSSITTAVIDPKESPPDALNTYVVESDGQPGDVQTQLWSEDTSTRFPITFAGKDAKDDRNAGMHPWTVQNGTRDDLLLYNQTESDQLVNLKISNRVNIWASRISLKPHQTTRISPATVAVEQQLDDSMAPFNLGLGEGEISWYTNRSGTVTGRLQHVDTHSRLISSFQCAGYVVFCGIGPITGPSQVDLKEAVTYTSGAPMSCVNNQAPNQCYGVGNGSYNPQFDWYNPGGELSLGPNGGYSINATGASVGSGYIAEIASDWSGMCAFTQTLDISVSNCPTSVSVGTITQEPLSATYTTKGDRTGLGIVSAMKVSGYGTYDWTSPQLTETVNLASNSCPSSGWPTPCPGGGTFTMDVLSTAYDGQAFPAVVNQFYDQHLAHSNVSLLNYSGIQSCTTVCSQTYSCAGRQLNGRFTITYSYTRGTLNGQPVTNVQVTKH
jgi:hypothetical protein